MPIQLSRSGLSEGEQEDGEGMVWSFKIAKVTFSPWNWQKGERYFLHDIEWAGAGLGRCWSQGILDEILKVLVL